MMQSDARRGSRQSRRDFLRRAGATATGLVFAPVLLRGRFGAAGTLPRAMRIGIIGSGRIGGAVSLQWAEAGHEILFSSRHPEELTELVERAGPRTSAGLPGEAAEKVGIPIAGDDEGAVRTAAELVVDAGFNPVVVGPLGRAREFDQGTPVYVTDMTATQLREALGQAASPYSVTVTST